MPNVTFKFIITEELQTENGRQVIAIISDDNAQRIMDIAQRPRPVGVAQDESTTTTHGALFVMDRNGNTHPAGSPGALKALREAIPADPCPICSMPMSDFDGGCVRHDPEEIAEWVKEHPQPDAQGDEAAVLLSMISILELNGSIAQPVAADARKAVSSLRAKLAEAEKIIRLRNNMVHDLEEAERSTGRERDRLAAQVADLQRRLKDDINCLAIAETAQAGRDHAEAELAAHKHQIEACRHEGGLLSASLAAMTERAEKAEAEARHEKRRADNREYVGKQLADIESKLVAARAEADALRAAIQAALKALGHVEDNDALKCSSILERAIRAAGAEIESPT